MYIANIHHNGKTTQRKLLNRYALGSGDGNEAGLKSNAINENETSEENHTKKI